MITGCALRNAIEPEMPITETIEFRLLGGSTSHNREGIIKGYFVAQGDKAVIYKEAGTELSLYIVNKMLQDLDYNWDEFTNIYGGISDNDKNGKVVIMFFDFRGGDSSAFVSSANNSNWEELGDWRGEIVFMNIKYIQAEYGNFMCGTLYHELVHLACHTKIMDGEPYGIWSGKTWLFEAIAQSGTLFVEKPIYYTDIENNRHYQTDYTVGTMLFNNLYIDCGSNKNIFKDILNMRNTNPKNRIRNVIKKYNIKSEIDYEYILNRLPDNGRLNQ